MKLLNNQFMYFSILIGLIDKFFSINMLCVFFPYIYLCSFFHLLLVNIYAIRFFLEKSC